MKQQTTTVTNTVEKQTSRIANSFKKIGRTMAAVLSIAAIVSFGRSCIQLGSDLTEVQNVVDVTFGAMSKQVDAFSKKAITQFGLSETAAKKYMGIYGAMSKSFGFDPEETYAMSAAITGLTGDVASFYNIPIEQASTRLKAIWTGETESLKELGVVMTQNALDQFALANGYGKTTSKMSEQEKVMLRYKFVLDQLSDASGDFQRTSGQWANQTRVLALQFDQLKATIGQGLINALTPVIQVINTILAKLQTLANYFKAFTQALFGHAGGGSNPVAKAADSMSSAAGSSGALARNMGRAADSAKKMKDYTLGIDELNILRPEEENSGSGGSGGEGGGGGVPDFGNMGGELFGEVTVNPEIEAAVARMKEALDRLKDAVRPTTDAIKRLWDEGLNLLGRFTWTALKDFWDYFLVPLGSWALGEGLPRFFDITNEFLKTVNWDAINEALRNFWKALEPFAEGVGAGLLSFYQDLSKLGANFINSVVPGGIQALSNALNNIDADEAKQIGYALGLIASALAAIGLCKAGQGILLTLFEALPKVSAVAGVASLAMIISGIRNDLEKIKEIGLPEWQKDNRENDSGSPWNTYGEDTDKSSGQIAADKNKANPYTDYGIDETWFTKLQDWQAANKKARDEEQEAFGEWAEGIKEKLLLKIDSFKEWQQSNREKRDVEKEEFAVWWDGIGKTFNTGWSDILEWWNQSGIKAWWDNAVSPWFTKEKWSQLYNTIKTELKTKWDETVGAWQTSVTDWWNQTVAPWFTIQKWSRLYDTIKTTLKTKWDETVGVWSANITNWWNQKVAPWFTLTKWLTLYDSFKISMGTKWDETSEQWKTNISSWWNKHVAPWFTAERWLELYDSVKTSLLTRWNEVWGDWKINLSKWWNDDVAPWFKLETWIKAMKGVPTAFGDTFRGAVNAAVGQLNKLIDWVNEHLHFEYGGLEFMGEEILPSFSVQLFTIPHMPTFATGGFPEDGLFMANSGELVGKISNGKTAVANNEQIVSGIQRGVESANEEQNQLLREQNELLREQNHLLERDTVIQMDSREVGKSIRTSERRGGYRMRVT